VIRTVGSWMRGIRAGEAKVLSNAPGVVEAPASIVVTSAAFAPGAPIPRRHAGPRVGENIAPPLAWTNVPAAAAELVVVVEDPDAPLPRPFVHLVAYGIAPGAGGVAEGALASEESAAAAGARLGKATLGGLGYRGPGPVPGHGPHTYAFQVLALAARLDFARTPPGFAELVRRMRGQVLARGRLDGTYER
jgi:Raf kinase inhibitor-like YbhB/YbcL family protein